MGAISLRLPEDIEQQLAAEAKREGRPRSEIVREAIADYLTRRERERFMAEIIAAANAIGRDTVASAETRELANADDDLPPEDTDHDGFGRWWR
jgi:predicted DNA-binding protein